MFAEDSKIGVPKVQAKHNIEATESVHEKRVDAGPTTETKTTEKSKSQIKRLAVQKGKK
jgi:hypothetical protein